VLLTRSIAITPILLVANIKDVTYERLPQRVAEHAGFLFKNKSTSLSR
jgi:hypothetical protein